VTVSQETLKELDELFVDQDWTLSSYDLETKHGQTISCESLEDLLQVSAAICHKFGSSMLDTRERLDG
jgi:hypothetical protein